MKGRESRESWEFAPGVATCSVEPKRMREEVREKARGISGDCEEVEWETKTGQPCSPWAIDEVGEPCSPSKGLEVSSASLESLENRS